MPRWPCVHILCRSCTDFRASQRTEPQLVKLMLPHAVFCARPHLITTPSDSRSCIRATGTLCEIATLKRTENCHQERATESSASTSSRLGITSRCAIPKAYGCQLGRLVIQRTHLRGTSLLSAFEKTGLPPWTAGSGPTPGVASNGSFRPFSDSEPAPKESFRTA